jgi:hypothetical protein
MYSGLIKHIFLLFRYLRKICGYTVLLGMVAMMAPSCSGSKKSSSIRQLEKHSRKNPVDAYGNPVPSRNSGSKKVRQAMAQQQKQQEAAKKEADKAYKDGITRHRSLQTQETRDRMDQHLKETNQRHSKKKDFFLVRLFRPSDDIEKIEKRREKEVQKRMAANRKTAEKNNEVRRISSVKTKERKSVRPNPKDYQHGGGGTYKEGSATRYASPANMQMGGGGTYNSGSSKIKASDFQHGGGGSYQEGKSKKRVKASSTTANTKGTSPRNNPYSKRSKPKPE